MARQLRDNWKAALEALQPGWSSDKSSKPITAEAIATLCEFSVVPCTDGGIQLEIHRDGLDFELDIGPDGRIESVFVGRAR